MTPMAGGGSLCCMTPLSKHRAGGVANGKAWGALSRLWSVLLATVELRKLFKVIPLLAL